MWIAIYNTSTKNVKVTYIICLKIIPLFCTNHWNLSTCHICVIMCNFLQHEHFKQITWSSFDLLLLEFQFSSTKNCSLIKHNESFVSQWSLLCVQKSIWMHSRISWIVQFSVHELCRFFSLTSNHWWSCKTWTELKTFAANGARLNNVKLSGHEVHAASWPTIKWILSQIQNRLLWFYMSYFSFPLFKGAH